MILNTDSKYPSRRAYVVKLHGDELIRCQGVERKGRTFG